MKWTFLVPLLGRNSGQGEPHVLEAQLVNRFVEVEATPFEGDIENRFLGQPLTMSYSHPVEQEVTEMEKFYILGTLAAFSLILTAVGFGVLFASN